MNNIVENRLIDLNFNFDRRDDMNLIQKTSYIDNFDTKTSIDSHTHLTNFRNYNIKIIAFEKKKKKNLKIQNENFRQNVFRFRNFRNQYREKIQHWKIEIIKLQSHYNIDVDFDVEKYQFSRLFIDAINRFFSAINFFAQIDFHTIFVFSNILSIIFLDDINDFSDNRNQWFRWNLQSNIKFRKYAIQYSIEWNKIEYVKNYCIDNAFNIIKTKIDFKFRDLYFILIELLKNLNHIFDDDENIQYNKIEQKLMNFEFKIINKKIFDEFLIRFIITLTFLNYFEI